MGKEKTRKNAQKRAKSDQKNSEICKNSSKIVKKMQKNIKKCASFEHFLTNAGVLAVDILDRKSRRAKGVERGSR